MTSLNNFYLIEACRKGDPKAQLQVYKLFFSQMLGISLKLVNDADAAGEIVREAFFTVFDRKDAYKEQSDFISRLKKLVEDRSVETWRRNNVPFPNLKTDKIL
jgi:RNA polymerase sigma-70 factor (ECF subfamily)